MSKSKKIDIFCGTGGVGKTTLATSRAYFLANQGKSVLLMTIDPSLRLKQLFSLSDAKPGIIQKVVSNANLQFQGELSVLLMDTSETLLKALGADFTNNHILESLSRPYSGMNEIMALVELNEHAQSGTYDHIILDTPPGNHFVDFLNSAQKINNFFDHSFIQYFSSDRKKGIPSLIEVGMKKLIGYLRLVTGEGFIDAFAEAISILYNKRDKFLDALKLQEELLDPNISRWFLVTSSEQQKMSHCASLQRSINQITHSANTLIINKSLYGHLTNWSPVDEQMKELKKTMLKHENEIKRIGKEAHNQLLLFPEVIDKDPKKHVQSLCDEWGKQQ
jgi:anion-transporting  ArsA/GET3 family ATPase